MGSSNGTWINSHKLLAGKKTVYKSDDIIHMGKATSAVTVTVENVSAQKFAINSDEEKTLVYKLPINFEQKTETVVTKKVANGDSIVFPTPSKNLTKSSMKLVDGLTENRQGLGDKVKNLINLEADKLRQQATIDSKEIIRNAHILEKEILDKAHKNAKKIIHKAKLDALECTKESVEEIEFLNEKRSSISEEIEELVKNHKLTSSKISNSINNLKHIESEAQQKIKSLESNVFSIQDKIRIDTLFLEDIKQEGQSLKKSAEIKLEEVFTEERRIRARIETEMIESKVQTAKIFAEAEKVQSHKYIMEAEISELRSSKGEIERDVNEQKITFKRQEFELEKLTYEYNNLLSEKLSEQSKYENLLNKISELAEKFNHKENALIEEQRELQEKVDGLKVIADQIIHQAEQTAEQIIQASHEQARKLADETEDQLRDLEEKRSVFYIDLELEKKIRLQEVDLEIKTQKSVHENLMKKIEEENARVTLEIKVLEESVQDKCQKMMIQAQKEAGSLKITLQKESLNYKNLIDFEFQALKALHLKENEVVREKVQLEIQKLKDQANKEIIQRKNNSESEIAAKNEEIEKHLNQLKLKADNIIIEEKAKWENKHQKLQAEIKHAEELTKKQTKIHEAALAKTEGLKDEKFIRAQQQIETMLADARTRALALQQEASERQAQEYAEFLEMKKAEALRMDALMVRFEQTKIEYRQEKADEASLAVHEFLTNDLIKKRNLILNEALIKKIAERARKLVVEASLGRIQASENGIKPMPTINHRKILKWAFRLCGLVAFLYMASFIWSHYPNEVKMIINEAEKLITNTQFSADDIPNKNQIIEILR